MLVGGDDPAAWTTGREREIDYVPEGCEAGCVKLHCKKKWDGRSPAPFEFLLTAWEALEG